MRSDLTDITLVVDRSGSMDAIREDAEGGLNALIREQAALPGEAVLTLVEFDSEYDVVHSGKPIGDVPPYRLVPRGHTALLDAVGRAVAETGERLAKMEEKDRPGLVLFAIVTDGLENASREYTKARVREMIEIQQRDYSWQFTFLGANQDAFAEARSMGVVPIGAAGFSPDKVGETYRATSSKFGRMRGAAASGQTVDNAFTDAERQSMK